VVLMIFEGMNNGFVPPIWPHRKPLGLLPSEHRFESHGVRHVNRICMCRLEVNGELLLKKKTMTLWGTYSFSFVAWPCQEGGEGGKSGNTSMLVFRNLYDFLPKFFEVDKIIKMNTFY